MQTFKEKDHGCQRFVSSTVNMDVLLSHLQLNVDVWPILTQKSAFKAKICLFVTFMLINFLVQLLRLQKLQFCTCFAHENPQKTTQK